jgi:hypothetical protein
MPAVMPKIVWRNPRPPAQRSLWVAEVGADESRAAPMWIIYYQTIEASGRPSNEYELLVSRRSQRVNAAAATGFEVRSCM